MSDAFGDAKDGWVSRYRQRRATRRERRADRRARRKGRLGGNPGDAAARARSSNFQSGGYFTTKSGGEPKP
jgi:hypothetical protein